MEWGLLALLSVVSALVPRDRFVLCPSIKTASAMWICLVQPGATNSSGIISVVAKSVTQLLARLHKHEVEVAERPEGSPDDVIPPRRQLLAGGGSLAATGLQMSKEENRGAALSVEPEIPGVALVYAGKYGGRRCSGEIVGWCRMV